MTTPPTITVKRFLSFFLGGREAVLMIAQSRLSLLLACLFIVSAGLARNYDHHILTEEWLWIGGPFGMVLLSSALIFGFINTAGKLPLSAGKPGNYSAFLRCFAMTAPLAWLYGIPVESFISLLTATIFNFCVLVVVSIWRVALMVRVLQVLFGFSVKRASALVMIPAGGEMWLACQLKAMSIVGIMGGMRLSEGDRFLLTATEVMSTGALVFVVVGVVLMCLSKGGRHAAASSANVIRFSRPLWCAALASVVAWFVLALPFQEKLANRNELRKFIRGQNWVLATEFLKGKTEADFPHWLQFFDRPAFHFQPKSALNVLLVQHDLPRWLRLRAQTEVEAWIEASKQDRRFWNDGELSSDALYGWLYGPYMDSLRLPDVVKEISPEFNLEAYRARYADEN